MLTGNIILKVLVAKQTEQKMCPCICEYNFLMTLLTTEGLRKQWARKVKRI